MGKAIEIGQSKDTLAERLIDEQTVSEMIALEPNSRNKLLIRLTCASGGRVSEIISLKWPDLRPDRAGAGVVTLYGKGGKTRHVRIPAKLWTDLERAAAGDEDPVFASRKKRTDRNSHLTATQAWRLVRGAAARFAGSGCLSPLAPPRARNACAQARPPCRSSTRHLAIKTRTTQRYEKVNPQESSSDYLVIS